MLTVAWDIVSRVSVGKCVDATGPDEAMMSSDPSTTVDHEMETLLMTLATQKSIQVIVPGKNLKS